MTRIEDARFRVREAMTASHGEEVASELMELLPTVAWADLATKTDLAGARREIVDLRAEMLHRFQMTDECIEHEARMIGKDLESLEYRFTGLLERELRRQTARFTVSLFAGLSLFSFAWKLF